MSTLFLIRHGQASFGAADYDVLSDLGVAQSRQLGAHWAAAGPSLHACYSGPRRRQRDSARHFRDGLRGAGGDCPEAIELADLDEYPAFALLARWMPTLVAEDPGLAASAGDAVTGVSGDAAVAAIAARATGAQVNVERALALMASRWARGEGDSDDIESFRAFAGRVGGALDRIMADEGRGRRVAVFTSGGPISIALQRALNIANEKALETAWVIANSSVSEFRWRDPTQLRLVTFNGTPHLSDDAMLTYR